MKITSTEYPQIPGFSVTENFINDDQAQKLMENINKNNWEEKSYHKDGLTRRVQHYGKTTTKDPKLLKLRNPNIPNYMDNLLNKLNSLDQVASSLDQVTINEYLPGAFIPPHIDSHRICGDIITVVSLGSGTSMIMKNDTKSYIFWIPKNSLIILKGEARYSWQHGIPGRKIHNLDDGTTVKNTKRISVTFRHTTDKKCKCDYPESCIDQGAKFRIMHSRLGDAVEMWRPIRSESDLLNFNLNHNGWFSYLKISIQKFIYSLFTSGV